MEQIKIIDKLTLRQEALRMAVELSHSGATNVDVIKLNAHSLASFIQGDADLPEYEDTHKDFKEMFAKMQESFKPKPLLWRCRPA